MSREYIEKALSEQDLLDVTDLQDQKVLKVGSLFAGCGGMDLGFLGGFSVFAGTNKVSFEKNPFKLVWANDIYEYAVKSYKHNIGNHIVLGDILDIDENVIPEVDIILGGFPCQDFSISGKQAGLESERGQLYKQIIRIVEAKRPLAFVAENVKNLLNPKLVDAQTGISAFDTICKAFNNIGYDIYTKLLQAPDYGIPQRRERVFIVGIRKDCNSEYKFPNPHHSKVTTEMALDDLWGKEENSTIPNHNQRSLAKFKPPSKNGNQGNYQIPRHGFSQVMRAEHHMNIQAHYRTYNENEPLNRDYWRRLTVREAARLQAFPDSFKFIGEKSHAYKQLGNAVPPVLAWYLARSVYRTVTQE